MGQLPKMPFPKFDGDNPQLWITQAQNYFEMYCVDQSVWIKCATMQFTGAAKRWLQSIERQLPAVDWAKFCRLIHERFSRDQHELLLRQLFHIKQTGSVQEYVDQFIALIENLSAYTTNPDLLSYITHFVDGLHDDIRVVLLVQRPQTLDAACTLALLQEEAADPGQHKDIKKNDGFPSFKPPAAKTAGLPPPPPKPGVSQPAEVRKASDDKRPPGRPTMDERLQSLRSYRRARGLCIRCAEKWHPGHKCAPVLQLHALQEV